MAIDAYTGLPRSGKSYSVVKNVILPSLREGRHVYTNIPLTELLHQEFTEQIHQLDADWFKQADLADLFPPGAVVVLDELWRRWPSGLKASAANFKDKEFLAEHGHNVNEKGETTRVVLVTQDLSQIAAFARELVAVTYRTTKLDAVGADNRFRVDVYQGSVTGQRPPKAQLIRSLYDKYEADVYRYYKSSTKSQTGDVGNEKRADKRANVWRSPWLIFSLVAPLIGIPLGVWHMVNMFGSGLGMVDKVEASEAASAPAAAPAMVNPLPADLQPVAAAPAAPARPAGPVESQLWRVVGSVERSNARPEPAGWDSQLGYNRESDPVEPVGNTPDLVIVRSALGALRYVPSTDCERYPDGIHYHCMISGEMVTPWSGMGGATGWASDGGQLVARTATVATEAKVNPAP